MKLPLFRKIQDELISQINLAENSLKIAVTWFTNHELFNAVLSKLDKEGFHASLIVLNDRINNKKEGVDFQQFIKKKGNFYYSVVENMVHHKFCIIDDKIVVTGSYNWTYYAEQRNWENVMIIENEEAVSAYIKEFNKIIKQHSKVKKVLEAKRVDAQFGYDEYLLQDSLYQAQKATAKGDEIAAAKVYTEILKRNSEQPQVQKLRTETVQKIVEKKFDVCPFEIGILFNNGYKMVIPAFSNLPVVKYESGSTIINNQTAVSIIIQKNDYANQTILQFTLDKIEPSPEGTLKIVSSLTVDTNGILTVLVKEVNGFGRARTEKIDLRKFI